jgi:DNA-directed RNA polymerase subunit N (RpoN/RPB10)
MSRPAAAELQKAGPAHESTRTKPRPGARIAKADVEKLAVQYAAESKMVGSSAIRFIAEDESEFDFERDFQPPRCKCNRVMAFRLGEYQRRVKEKRADQTLGDILDDMGIDPHKCLSCRDYFINQFKFTSGTLNSGDVTILPADETRPFPRRIENNLPRDLHLEGKEMAYYDKWSPTPVPKSFLVKQTIFTSQERAAGVKPKMVPKLRRYHLTGYQIKATFDSYLDLYKAWSKTMGKLLPVWADAVYPDISFEESRTLIESAFFQELCDIFTEERSERELEQKRATKFRETGLEEAEQDELAKYSPPRPTRKNLFDMQIQNNVDQHIEDRQNCYLYFRSNDKPPETRATLLIPTAKRALYFIFSEDELVLKDDFRFAGDSLTEIISGNTKASETLLGLIFSWKDAQVYIRKGQFHLPSEVSARKLIDNAIKRLHKEAALSKAAAESDAYRPQEITDSLIVSLDDIRRELEQVVYALQVAKAEAQAELNDLEAEWQT